jgi:integrase
VDNTKKMIKTLADVSERVEAADLAPCQLRDKKSAINRVSTMAGMTPAQVEAEPTALRATLSSILPAAHGVNPKTWANLVSQLRAALRLAGVIDQRSDGIALKDPAWAPLLEAIAEDKRLSCGLAAFANYCSLQAITPPQVDDLIVQQFHSWLETRTLCPKPRDVVRRVPHLWYEASEKIELWPKRKLNTLSFKRPPKRLQWCDLPQSLLCDADAYLAMRGSPDVFDERPNAPRKPLAASTLHQQKEHLRLAASVLVESGIPVEEITLLAELAKPERFKTVLRHYHEHAEGRPNAFAIGLSQTMLQVARHHLLLSDEELSHLRRIASKLPAVPVDLTPKNKAVVFKFESDTLKAKLLFLPDELQAEVTRALEKARLLFVEAQMAVAIDVQLAIALRPQNLSALNWRRHFVEPEGPRGRLLLVIPAAEMKSRKDFIAEIPIDVARRLRWYRRTILPRLSADPGGDLFVTAKGIKKDQRTLTLQMLRTIRKRLGVHLTTHQYRHLLGNSYLDANPQDTETARLLLGHAWTKTTRIYLGSQTRRASRAYNEFLLEQRDRLKLRRKRQLPRKRKSPGEPSCAN